MSRIELPKGQWADLRDPDDVTERQRRPILKALRRVRPEVGTKIDVIAAMPNEPDGSVGPVKASAIRQLMAEMTDGEAEAYQESTDYGAVALVEQWSYANPVTIEGYMDLPAKAVDALREAVAPVLAALFVDFTPNPEAGKDAPFVSFNGSAMPLSGASLTTYPTTSGSTGSFEQGSA